MQGKKMFKNNSGVWYTRALFFETAPSKETVLYTLKTEDHGDLPSLHRLFVETADPTEYRFATEYLGGWGHWKALKESEWFKPYYNAMAEELEIKQRSEALANVFIAADKPTREGIEASKYIAEKKWDKKPISAAQKKKISAETQKIYESDKRSSADFDRLTLN